jgi:hypothetical protein
MRWCRHADLDGACQIFMRRMDPVSPAQWETFVEQLGFAPAPPLPGHVARTRELWRNYAAWFADERSSELYTNVAVFDTAHKPPPASPVCPVVPRADGRRRKSPSTDREKEEEQREPKPCMEATPPPFTEIIRKLLEETFPGGYPRTGALDVNNWDGIGYLRPDLVPSDGMPTTLELHRRVIALERAGAALLKLLFTTYTSRSARGCFLTDEAVDADIAFGFQGGVAGDGARYWVSGPPPPLAAPRQYADVYGLYHTMCYLHVNRAAALQRRYAVADDGAWGLPVFARLHSLTAMGGAAPEDLARAVEELVAERRAAVLADRVRLARYGCHMTHYCLRMQVILRQWLTRVPPAIAVARFPGDPDGRVLPVLVDQTFALDEAVADQIVGDRLGVEWRDIGKALRGLRVPYRDPLVYVHVVTRGVHHAMETDGHQHDRTCFLHPSPSMPDAHNAAYMYAANPWVE